MPPAPLPKCTATPGNCCFSPACCRVLLVPSVFSHHLRSGPLPHSGITKFRSSFLLLLKTGEHQESTGQGEAPLAPWQVPLLTGNFVLAGVQDLVSAFDRMEGL